MATNQLLCPLSVFPLVSAVLLTQASSNPRKHTAVQTNVMHSAEGLPVAE